MGRKRLPKERLKVKFGISLKPELFDLIGKEGMSRSKFVEKLVREYYENKNL